MKLDSFLKPFRGRDDNFQTFWSKFLVLAEANGWDTDDKKMSKLPLLLDGAAYTVVDQLPSADKKKPDKVKAALETAFSPSPAEAYHLFVARRLLLDEPVDSYVADLQRLLTLSQHRVADNGKDPVLIEQFLSGLPAEIGKTLRLAHAADEHTISQLVSKARTMQASNGVARVAAATTAMLCYNCNQVGHLRRNCPRLKRGDGQGSSDGSDKRSGGGTSVRCFKCGKVGHIRNCRSKPDKPASASGSGKQGTAAAATGSSSKTESRASKCFAVVSAPSDLVGVAVEVQPLHDTSTCSSNEWRRQTSVVDTGCTRSLIELPLVEQLGMQPVQAPQESLISIEGKHLSIHGTVHLSIRRLDGPVYLPLIHVSLLVVDNLSALDTDILVGSDIVAQAGGLDIQYDGPGGPLLSVIFGPKPHVAGAGVESSGKRLPRHVSVSESGNTVKLSTTDVTATWDEAKGYWQAEWTWKDGIPPSSPLGSGIGEYPRSN